MTIESLLTQLESAPSTVEFDDVIATIDASYMFTPTAFRNGDTYNGAGQNNGSCKIFAFAKLHGLSESSTLYLFGKFYREDVLRNPRGISHQNIRNFINRGWAGIKFEGEALTAKKK